MFAASKTAAVASAANYIEDVFSTYLYAGNSAASRSIVNGIDLSTKGGLVWVKDRTVANGHILSDTARGAGYWLTTNGTGAQSNANNYISAFNVDGFNVNYAGSGANATNFSGDNYASWTFRKQAKFFDVVTYTGDGTNDRPINHNLGSVPGCIIVKRTDSVSAWSVYHRSLPAGTYNRNLYLNTTASYDTNVGIWGTSDPTSTQFRVGTAGNLVNVSGATYVAYLFAHDAGGFGAAGTDNVISCGSFNYTAFPQSVSLGYEPQWLIAKRSDGVGDWIMFDSMRGFTANGSGGRGKYLLSNSSAAEVAGDDLYYGSATSFALNLPAFGNYIYIAIRRGPMRTPTSGTSVFAPVLGTAGTPGVPTSFTVDSAWMGFKTGNAAYPNASARLIGGAYSTTSATAVESVNAGWKYDFQTGFGTSGFTSGYIGWMFQRAPGFFDVVCYTGTGADMTIPHNLGVRPEIIILKKRSAAGNNWPAFWAGASTFTSMYLNTTQVTGGNAGVNLGYGGGNALSAAPTSTNFYLTNDAAQTTLSATFVAYLFATLPGVSKVGSYTGTGALQTINCGFAAGARFVLIKRTDSTGDWYVYDSARGITSGNDPYILLNSTAAEVTSTNYVDTASSGFQVTAAAPAGLNANGGTYIFLAIA